MALLLLGSCGENSNKAYSGEHPELYSVAINSLLGAKGYAVSEIRFSSTAKIVEEDEYGRQLFFYFENKSVSTYSLLISQKSDDEYVYFYPDYNFISIPEGEQLDTGLLVTSEKNFEPEDIEKLKRENDWNQEINLDKCVKVEIVHQKKEGPVKGKQLKDFYEQAFGDAAYADYKSYTCFFISDEYGRAIYLGTGTSHADYKYVVMLFQPDGSYDDRGLMGLSDTQKYQSALREFKELNDWNVEPVD